MKEAEGWSICKSASVLTRYPLFLAKEVFVQFLYVNCFFDSASDVVSNHQLGELHAINQHNARTQILCGL
jgi:hypothetical protein